MGNNVDNSTYYVAVTCATYNHAPYIEDALNGFANQETSFPVIYIVIDDDSTDGEQDVLRNWAENHLLQINDSEFWQRLPYGERVIAPLKDNPNSHFIILLLKENYYQTGRDEQKQKFFFEWVNKSKYHAFCEGDDYWIDPLKLEKQVAAMEKHPELDISAHAFKRTHAITGETVDERFLCHEDKVFPMEKVIMGEGGFVGTPTLMLRSSVYENKKNLHFWSMMDYDYTLQMAGSLRGGLLYLKDSMVNKRTRVPGSFTNKHRASNKQFKVDYNEQKNNMLQQLDSDTNGRFHNVIYARLLLNNIRNYNSTKENRSYFKKYRDGLVCISFTKKIRVIALSYFPIITMTYKLVKKE